MFEGFVFYMFLFVVAIIFLFFLLSFLIQVKVAVQYMRRVIQKKAKFDIMDLNCLKVSLWQ